MSPNRLNSGGQLVANFRGASNPHSPRRGMLPMEKGPTARSDGASTSLDWWMGRGTGFDGGTWCNRLLPEGVIAA